MSNKHHYGDPEVANPWDNGQEPTDPLPNSELNPLLNPTLGRNLGRWAQVYYTNPPEKREEAVGELLRQLENEDPGIGITEAPRAERLDANSQAELFCGTCQFKNEANQRFCGHCGSPLPAGSALSVRAGGEAFGDRPPPDHVAVEEKAAAAGISAPTTGVRLAETSIESPAQKLSAGADSASEFKSQAGEVAEGDSQELLLA